MAIFKLASTNLRYPTKKKMNDEDSENTHPDDGAAPVPLPPAPAPPPETEETKEMSIDGDAPEESAADHAHEVDNDQPTIDDGYVKVIRNGRVRQERKEKADENTIAGHTTQFIPTRLSNVPPPPDAPI